MAKVPLILIVLSAQNLHFWLLCYNHIDFHGHVFIRSQSMILVWIVGGGLFCSFLGRAPPRAFNYDKRITYRPPPHPPTVYENWSCLAASTKVGLVIDILQHVNCYLKVLTCLHYQLFTRLERTCFVNGCQSSGLYIIPLSFLFVFLSCFFEVFIPVSVTNFWLVSCRWLLTRIYTKKGILNRYLT